MRNGRNHPSQNDHRIVEQLFERFEQAGERADVQKRQIVDRIIEELSVHPAIEEQVAHPVARATVPNTEYMALESLEELRLTPCSARSIGRCLN